MQASWPQCGTGMATPSQTGLTPGLLVSPLLKAMGSGFKILGPHPFAPKDPEAQRVLDLAKATQGHFWICQNSHHIRVSTQRVSGPEGGGAQLTLPEHDI
jgi:hypothetical protein